MADPEHEGNYRLLREGGKQQKQYLLQTKCKREETQPARHGKSVKNNAISKNMLHPEITSYDDFQNTDFMFFGAQC